MDLSVKDFMIFDLLCYACWLLFSFLGMFPLPGIALLSRFLFPDLVVVLFLRHFSTSWHWPSFQVSISWSCCCSLSWTCFHFLALTFYPGSYFLILLLFSFLGNYVVWPIFFLMNVFIALKGTHIWSLFVFTAAGIVPCGGRKTSPRTSTIVQFIFCFWSFEISVNILRNQK